MKKVIRILLSTAAVAAVVASCAKEPAGYEVDKTAVVLEAYGPNPVLRGATLTFVGQNLDKITSVELGGGVTITEFTDKSANKFTLTVPIEAEAGAPVLTYAGGTITAKTALTFTEPFYITKVTGSADPLVPGDLLTIEGDYLNNIVSVGFANNQNAVTLSESFTEATRYKIIAPVARGAVSGRIFIADANGNQFYSEESLTVSQPTVGAVSPATARPGDEVTISGTMFSSIDAITFAGSSAIEADGFEVVSEKSIKVTVPADVHDGAIALLTAAGEKLQTTNEIAVKVPSNLAVAAASGFKAGNDITITGDDIDLVTSVAFGSVAVEDFVNDGTTVTATIPATAVDGVVTLGTAAEKTVDTEALTLVKPVITSVSPTAITAGADITVTGTDLDLVASVTMAGEAMTFDAVSETQIIVHTTATVPSGTIIVKAANGVTSESESITVTYDSLLTITSFPSSASVGEEITMEGSNFNIIDAIYFGDVKVTAYTERTNTRFIFQIPADVQTGTYNVRFVLFNGDEETCPYAIEVKGAISSVVAWEGECDLGDSWGAYLQLSGDKFAGMFPGCDLHVEYSIITSSSKGPQLKLMNGSWAVLAGFPANEWGCVDMEPGSSHYSFTPTAQDVADLTSGGMVVAGQAVIITKVYYTYENTKPEPVLPTDIMLNDYEKHGNHDGSWDASWSGCAGVVEEDGNHYLEVTSEAVNAWIINCNHFDDVKPALPDGEVIENYVVKMDIFIPAGWSQDGTCKAQLVLGDQWNWWGETFLAGITGNGMWQTFTFEHGFSGAFNLMGGTNGLFIDGSSVQALPVGMKFDNFRLSHK